MLIFFLFKYLFYRSKMLLVCQLVCKYPASALDWGMFTNPSIHCIGILCYLKFVLGLNVYALNSLCQHPHNRWWATSLDLSRFSTTQAREWHSITMATVMHCQEGPFYSDNMWSQTFSTADAGLGMHNSWELLSSHSRRWNSTLNHLFR